MEKEWYYARDGQQLGPVDIEELRRDIEASTLVWKEGMSDWVAAEQVDDLLPPKPKGPPPLPPSTPPSLPASQTPETDNDTAVHLANLQDALLEGRIDKQTYKQMKGDLEVKATPVAGKTQEESGPPASPDATWVQCKIQLAGKGGSTSGVWLDVYLDDDIIGKGSDEGGISLEFETSVGHHSVKLRQMAESLDSLSPLKNFGLKLGKGLHSLAQGLDKHEVADVIPVDFNEPGEYVLTLKPIPFYKQAIQGRRYEHSLERVG